MADNVTLNAMQGGPVVAADDVSGVMVQRVKVGHGGNGAYADVTGSNPLPVGLAPGTSADAAVVVGSTGAPVRLPAVPGVLGLTVKAQLDNLGRVYLGGPGVTAASGFELAPGEAISADVTDPSALWLAVASDGDGACCLWVSA